MHYEVNEETLEINIYIEDQEAPLIYQPDQPDGTPWESAEQASAWAEEFIYNFENPPAPVDAPTDVPVEEVAATE
jgi:hypothetical protein